MERESKAGRQRQSLLKKTYLRSLIICILKKTTGEKEKSRSFIIPLESKIPRMSRIGVML